MGPMTVDLGLGGPAADTALAVAANVVGTVGNLRLTLQVPVGVTLTGTNGDWSSCSQAGDTITCTSPHAASGRWGGTIHTAWATGARGLVSATVQGTYANGAPASGSVATTWPP